MEVKMITATWCQPCKMMKKVVTDVCNELDVKLSIYDIEDEEGGKLIQEHQISSVPTLLFVGESTHKLSGVAPADVIRNIIQENN